MRVFLMCYLCGLQERENLVFLSLWHAHLTQSLGHSRLSVQVLWINQAVDKYVALMFFICGIRWPTIVQIFDSLFLYIKELITWTKIWLCVRHFQVLNVWLGSRALAVMFFLASVNGRIRIKTQWQSRAHILNCCTILLTSLKCQHLLFSLFQ